MHLVIPTGTKVVSRHDRRVGFIVHAPASFDNAYRVRFPDGSEASFRGLSRFGACMNAFSESWRLKVNRWTRGCRESNIL